MSQIALTPAILDDPQLLTILYRKFLQHFEPIIQTGAHLFRPRLRR